MAKMKRMMTTEQKIQRYKTRKKIGLAVKIIAAVAAVLIMANVAYYGYYYIVFTHMAQNDSDPDKNLGPGFSRPLHMIPEDDDEGVYILAYYYNNQWNVVDDSQLLKDNRDHFTIYKKDSDWHEGTHLQLMIIRNHGMLNNVPLSPFTLIDDRCFKNHIKTMTMGEFQEYCKEKHLSHIYIQ